MIDDKEQYEYIKFIRLLNQKNLIKNQPQILTGSIKERGFVDWSNKIIGFGLLKEFDLNGLTTAIYKQTEKGFIGFEELTFVKFYELVKQTQSSQFYNNLISVDELLKLIFDWLILEYEGKSSNQSLDAFLTSEINKLEDVYDFYFPIVNLDIECPFVIADVDFTFFTKEHLDNFYFSLKEKINADDFDELYRKEFQGHTLSHVSVKGCPIRAYEIAKEKTEISVDILKILGPAMIIPNRYINYDLSYRLNFLLVSKYLTKKQTDTYSYKLNIQNSFKPEFISESNINEHKEELIKIFSAFLLSNNNSELFLLVKQAISLLANALSIPSLHLRIVQLFTILESLLLEDDRDNKITSKTRARAIKLLNHKQKIIENQTLIDELYEIRHKMIHKAIKLELDLNKLSRFQFLVLNVILRIIQNIHLKEKYILIEQLDIIT